MKTKRSIIKIEAQTINFPGIPLNGRDILITWLDTRGVLSKTPTQPIHTHLPLHPTKTLTAGKVRGKTGSSC